jgi:cytochrome c553
MVPPLISDLLIREPPASPVVPFAMPWLPRTFGLPLMVVSALVLPGCGSYDSTGVEQFERTGELVALSGAGAGANGACFTCHGLDGAGDGTAVPRIAGLDQGYLVSQLEAYADGRRQHPQMAEIARRMDQRARLLVADYYARMPFQNTAPPAPGAAPALYTAGDAKRGMPSCASCHGINGEGVGPANPPLAGQPAAYLADQLHQWRQSRRRTDASNVMQRISSELTPREIEVLAAYAASLPGDPPNQAPRAASRAAHHADPRSDASMRQLREGE